MCRQPPEPTYDDVISKHGPSPRPRPADKKPKKTEAQDATYAAIVHNKQWICWRDEIAVNWDNW